MSRTFPTTATMTSAPVAVYNSLVAWTLSAWINLDVIQGNNILGKDPTHTSASNLYNSNGLISQFDLSNSFGSYAQGDTPYGESDSLANSITIPGWHHVCATFSWTVGGAPRLYLDGGEITYNPFTTFNNYVIAPNTTPPDDSAGGWLLGGGGDPGFTGQMALVQVYNIVLTGSQVLSLASLGAPAPASLVASWPLTNAAPTADVSGNSNALTDNGTTAGTSDPSSVGVYSVPDDRKYGQFANNPRNIQGTLTYDVPAHPSTMPPADSRVSGTPVDDRNPENIPTNSRVKPK